MNFLLLSSPDQIPKLNSNRFFFTLWLQSQNYPILQPSNSILNAFSRHWAPSRMLPNILSSEFHYKFTMKQEILRIFTSLRNFTDIFKLFSILLHRFKYLEHVFFSIFSWEFQFDFMILQENFMFANS